MIYNRTQADVDAALEILARMKQGEAITDDEKEQLERGTLTFNTLNRIEIKQAQLKHRLNGMGYWNTNVNNVTWGITSYFHPSDFNRIRTQTQILKNAFFTFAETPDLPDDNYRKYQTINDIEKILFDLEEMIKIVKASYVECGTIECGEELT